MARGRAGRNTAHAGLELGDQAGQFQELVIGFRNLKTVLFEHIRAVVENRGFRTEGQTVKRARGAGQIATLTTGNTDILHIAVDQVFGVIVRIGQTRVHEEAREVFQLVGIDIVSLGEHHIGDQVIGTLVERQLERLTLAHVEIGQHVHLDLDAGLLR